MSLLYSIYFIKSKLILYLILKNPMHDGDYG